MVIIFGCEVAFAITAILLAQYEKKWESLLFTTFAAICVVLSQMI